jgi:pyridoxal phosphate enzyme (YggS family)
MLFGTLGDYDHDWRQPPTGKCPHRHSLCGARARPGRVQLLAVSKTFGPEAVREAAAPPGSRVWRELHPGSRREDRAAAPDLRAQLQWHCIGPIQSNKTRLVAEHFDWAHTVDRLKIAQRLSEQRPAGLPPLQVCIQVNIDGGATKSGVAPDEALALAREVAALPRLALRGLMTIPEPAPPISAAQRAVHARPAPFSTQLRAQGLGLDTLSMGMSSRPGSRGRGRQHHGARRHGDFWRPPLRCGYSSLSCVEFFTSSITA